MTEKHDYSEGYYLLFRAISKGLEGLERLVQTVPPGDFDTIRDITEIAIALQTAQCKVEDMYIEDE